MTVPDDVVASLESVFPFVLSYFGRVEMEFCMVSLIIFIIKFCF